MTHGDWFVVGGFMLYCGAAVSYYCEGTYPFSLLYTMYAGGNVALLWAAHWRIK